VINPRCRQSRTQPRLSIWLPYQSLITFHFSLSRSRVPLFAGFGRLLSLKVIDDAIHHLQVDLLKGTQRFGKLTFAIPLDQRRLTRKFVLVLVVPPTLKLWRAGCPRPRIRLRRAIAAPATLRVALRGGSIGASEYCAKSKLHPADAGLVMVLKPRFWPICDSALLSWVPATTRLLHSSHAEQLLPSRTLKRTTGFARAVGVAEAARRPIIFRFLLHRKQPARGE